MGAYGNRANWQRVKRNLVLVGEQAEVRVSVTVRVRKRSSGILQTQQLQLHQSQMSRMGIQFWSQRVQLHGCHRCWSCRFCWKYSGWALMSPLSFYAYSSQKNLVMPMSTTFYAPSVAAFEMFWTPQAPILPCRRVGVAHKSRFRSLLDWMVSGCCYPLWRSWHAQQSRRVRAVLVTTFHDSTLWGRNEVKE